MQISPGLLGFIRGIGVVVLTGVLSYCADAAHLTFLSGPMSAVVASLALALEQSIEGRTGSALFGAVAVR